jgi:hypothetical protein
MSVTNKVEVILRPTVSRPVLVSGTHLGPVTNFPTLFDYFFFFLIFVYVGRSL